MDNDSEYDGNGAEESDLDSFTIDCADVFATLLSRRFPEIGVGQGMAKPWRPLIALVMPPQSGYTVGAVDAFAHDLMLKLFWEHATLISYVIVQPGEEEIAADEQPAR